MAAALLMMTQCKKENETPTDPAEGTVKMTVTAGPGRTDISTETGAITWSTGDKLYVSNGSVWLGYLFLEDGAGTANGTFTGNVTGLDDEGDACHFFYLGHDNVLTDLTGNSNDVSISMAEQDGTLEGAMKYHLGYGNTTVKVTGSEATGSVIMNTKIAIAHINFTDGTSAYTGSLTMGGTGISNTLSVSPDGSFSGSGTDGITIGGTTGERYVTLIPTGTTDVLSVAFTGDATGSMTFANGIQANKFYGMKDAIAVTLEAAGPTHEYVDLGLPSGLLWATCNVGADFPEGYGWYFMWGSTTNGGDSNCSWANCPGNGGNFSHNATAIAAWDATHLTNNVLNPEVDAARANWGGDWRMPTSTEWQELYDNTTSTWTTENGVNGRKFTSTKEGYTDKYIFLPAAGNRVITGVNFAGSYGYYRSGSLYSSNPKFAYVMFFPSDNVYSQYSFNREFGCTVRPVRVAR